MNRRSIRIAALSAALLLCAGFDGFVSLAFGLGVFASSESLLSANFTAEQNNTDFLILNQKRDAHLAAGIRF